MGIIGAWYGISPAEVEGYEPFEWWQEGVTEEDRRMALETMCVLHPLGEFEDHPRVAEAVALHQKELLQLVGKYWIFAPDWEQRVDEILAPLRATVEFGFITTDPGGGDYTTYRLYAGEELLDERSV